MIEIKCFIVNNYSNRNLIILLNIQRNLFKTKIPELEEEFHDLKGVFYKISNTDDFPLEFLKNICEIYKKTVNKNKYELIEFVKECKGFLLDAREKVILDIPLNNQNKDKVNLPSDSESETEKINKNEILIKEEKEYEDDDIDQKKQKQEEMDIFLLKNINVIVQNALSCEYLMKDCDIIQLRTFLKLNGDEQLILIKMFKKVKIWTKKSSLNKSVDNLINCNFVKDYKILFETSGNLDYNLLFTFLYNLNNDELKQLGIELTKVTKLKETKTKMKLNQDFISLCFINNPFYNLEFDSEIESLSKFNELSLNCSRIITTYNYTQLNDTKSKTKKGIISFI